MDEEMKTRYKAQTWWLRILKEMIDSGDWAKMGPYATSVYTVIKAHAAQNNGDSFPSQELIAEETGMSLSEVKRAVKKLVEMKYVKTSKVGRNAHYELVEKIQIYDDDGDAIAQAFWRYVPLLAQDALKEVENFAKTGNLDTSLVQVVHVKNLQVQLVMADQNQVTMISEVNSEKLQVILGYRRT